MNDAAENQEMRAETRKPADDVITTYLRSVSDIALVACADMGVRDLIHDLDGDMFAAVSLLNKDGLAYAGMFNLRRSVRPTTGLLNTPVITSHREYERMRRGVMDFAQFDYTKEPFDPVKVRERALETLADVHYAYIAILERLVPRFSDTSR